MGFNMDARQKTRKWHSKVKTGCDQCKQRRIKCDEHHPTCCQCQRAGKLCDYTPPKTKIFEISTGPKFESAQESQSYAYFVSEGANLLSTFQNSVGPFWQRLGLQIGHEYPAVKYGITAMGAIQGPLHHMASGQIATSRQPEANSLSLTSMARGMHLARLSDPKTVPLEAILSACVFFTASTIWMDKVGAPGIHIGAGMRLLEEYSNGTYEGTVSNKDDIDNIFRPMFRRLVVSACTFSDNIQAQYPSIPANYYLDIDLDNVGKVTNIEQAYETIGTLLKCVLRLREGATMEGILPRVAIALNNADDALTQLDLSNVGQRQLPSSTGNAFDHDYRHLRMHLATIRIMFAVAQANANANSPSHFSVTSSSSSTAAELEFDNHRKEFLFILVECKILLSNESASTSLPSVNSSTSNLKTSHGMIPPLFFVATKCRDWGIRQQALELLHSAVRVERGWTSCMATSLARFVVEKEHGVLSCGENMVMGRRREGNKGEQPMGNAVVRINLESVRFSSGDGMAYVEYSDCTAAATTTTAMTTMELPTRSSPPPMLSSPPLSPPPHPPTERNSLPFQSKVLYTTSLPYTPSPVVERDGVTPPMAGKVLRAFGHSGVVLYWPQIHCHCDF